MKLKKPKDFNYGRYVYAYCSQHAGERRIEMPGFFFVNEKRDKNFIKRLQREFPKWLRLAEAWLEQEQN